MLLNKILFFEIKIGEEMMVSKNDNGGLNNSSSNSSNCYKNPLVDWLFSLSPEQFSLLSSILGILLLRGLDLDQQNSLGNFLINIGTNMVTAVGQAQLLEDQQSSNNNDNNDIREKIEDLKKQICMLEKELDK